MVTVVLFVYTLLYPDISSSFGVVVSYSELETYLVYANLCIDLT